MRSFYCQRRIEDDPMCEIQCDHCKGYYESLAVEGWEESWEALNKNLPVDKRAYRLGWFDGRAESIKHRKEIERLKKIIKKHDKLREQLWEQFKKENDI